MRITRCFACGENVYHHDTPVDGIVPYDKPHVCAPPPKKKRVKAQRCILCGYRLLDRESLMRGDGLHDGFCARVRNAIVFYVAAWPSGKRFDDAAWLSDQAHAEAARLAPQQKWENL